MARSLAKCPTEGGLLACAKSSIAAYLLLLVPCLAVTAAELRVPEQFPTVAQAVAASQSGDTISIAPGNYNIGLVTLPSHNLTLTGRGNRADTVLTGTQISFPPTSAQRSISKLTIRSFTSYGAIQIQSSVVAISDVDFDQCNHGVFLSDGATANTVNCMFRNGVRGGYAYTYSQWNATDCIFLNNNNVDSYGGGVACHVGSGGTFVRCAFIRNRAAKGGAIGLSLWGGAQTFSGCYFEQNESPVGAVVWNEAHSCSLVNCTLCRQSEAEFSGAGGWTNGGGNQFFPGGCTDCNEDGKGDRGQILIGELLDSDHDGVPNACECIVCDVVRDRNVNGIDLGVLLGQWGPANQFTLTDFNQDGAVDGSDLGLLLGSWGPCPN